MKDYYWDVESGIMYPKEWYQENILNKDNSENIIFDDSLNNLEVIIERGLSNLPSVKISALNLFEIDSVILGLPYDLGSMTVPGARFAPEVIRLYSQPFIFNESNLSISGGRHQLTGLSMFDNHKVIDIGNIGDVKTINLSREETQSLIKMYSTILTDRTKFSVYLGGDHSVTYSIVQGILEIEETISLIIFDAHSDFQEDLDTRESQVLNNNFMNFIINNSNVEEIIYIGYRDVFDIENPKIKLIPPIALYSSVDKLDDFFDFTRKYYISMDVDCIDPFYFGQTGALIPNGLSPRDLQMVLHYICSNLSVVGMDIVEYSPEHSEEDVVYSMYLSNLILHCISDAINKDLN
ncbi:TPA: arginase family protein [Streptococcus suis]|nr:arginase family protein [Streptococcus suis]